MPNQTQSAPYSLSDPARVPNTRRFRIIAQDPSIKDRSGHILTAEVDVPAEVLSPGPTGYRVKLVDYDASTDTLYRHVVDPSASDAVLGPAFERRLRDAQSAKAFNEILLQSPSFHAENTYAICMRTLARFEFALGRRVCWGFGGHQIHIAPHAFADANAFYSEDDRGLFFGYFPDSQGRPVLTCLSHDIVAHETTHAILDGLRDRYTEPSLPDQAGFHEGFADVVALLSVFALPDVVSFMLDFGETDGATIADRFIEPKALRKSGLLGLAKEMGATLSGIRGDVLRRSVELAALPKWYMEDPAYLEEHQRGEILVAAILNAFVEMWHARLHGLGRMPGGGRDRGSVVEAGAKAADHLLTMAIRALDYCPPVDILFGSYLTALLTADSELVPDDSRFHYRKCLLESFAKYGIQPEGQTSMSGIFRRFERDGELVYGRTHFESMLRDREEVFRFMWENRKVLEIDDRFYTQVESVRPSTRVGPDGFALRETVVEYVQLATLYPRELKSVLGIQLPPGFPDERQRIFGGGVLVFDEYGRVKYHLRRPIGDAAFQLRRLNHLNQTDQLERVEGGDQLRLADLHRRRRALPPREPGKRRGRK